VHRVGASCELRHRLRAHSSRVQQYTARFQKDGRPVNTADKTKSVGVCRRGLRGQLQLKFHPGTFVTVGPMRPSLGLRDAKVRLRKPSEPCGQSITVGGQLHGDVFAASS
jgi:hypothetical protein